MMRTNAITIRANTPFELVDEFLRQIRGDRVSTAAGD